MPISIPSLLLCYKLEFLNEYLSINMTLYQFNALDETEQHEAVWNNGAMVGYKMEDEHRVLLYQLFSFYVELYYHVEYNVLRRLRSFSSTECLDAYIEQFNLDSLIDNEPS